MAKIPPVMKNKTLTSKTVAGVQGGKGQHMFGKTGVANQAPGTSATTRGTNATGRGGKGNHMFGKQKVKPARPL